MYIFGLFILIATCHSQMNSDWSFKARCDFLGGTYTRRSDYNDTNQVGERCEATFSYPTGDPLLARKFCEETVPFHIIDATADGPRTTCLSEAGLICKTNWVQLYGRCYFMEKKQMTYSEAQGYCKKLDSGIAFMHRDILPVHWYTYYTKSAKAWVDGTSIYRDNLKYNTGDNMMLVFDGTHYGIKDLSLIRVNGSVEKAFALCEYTPPMTRAESIYLLRRYSEIYHSGFTTSSGMFIRTASYRNADNEGRKASDSRYCEKAMKPFIHGAKVDVMKASDDEKEFWDRLTMSKNHSHTFYRSTEFFGSDKDLSFDRNARDLPDCQVKLVPGNRTFRTNSSTCDGATFSSAVKMVGQSSLILDRCSDALWGPMYCEAKLALHRYKPCPSGYAEYLRTSGVKWCHKHVATKLSAPDAETECQEDGAHLSGAESMHELQFMAGLSNNKTRDASWLGAQRREACLWGEGAGRGYKDRGECSRELVFQWINYAAINPPFFKDHTWDNPDEPNYTQESETCLELKQAKGRVSINDIWCYTDLTFFCGKEAEAEG